MKTIIGNNHTVDLTSVSKIFNGNMNKTHAVSNASLRIKKKELLLILGPSGSGKTTLLTLMSGLIKPSTGTVHLFGKNINDYTAKELQITRANKIGFIFQTFLLIEQLSVIENVIMILKFGNKIKSHYKERAFDLLVDLNIEHLAYKYPNKLSQGEKQRVAIARAFANEPDLIIADEPTASLETKQGFAVIELLHEYSKARNKSVVIASHDLRFSELADNVIHMTDGQILHAD